MGHPSKLWAGLLESPPGKWPDYQSSLIIKIFLNDIENDKAPPVWNSFKNILCKCVFIHCVYDYLLIKSIDFLLNCLYCI